ncbi:ATP-binding cassette domain-containing protein [Bifidobacterium gallicum]|uniref:ABC transporter, ATP-binding protein n=1 Tax=Bifidobacterium gallicum DSM 20093 = LMG 11596 TaxID=561180 RepID=D1NRW2_9BIFI|nr:ATP-binding cassette domain-containing protein [Bifidobacterium gallicum]EFA23414.1 ABC transporter, ATP-binding protein [Bifidobacterium gallicum DSM 20093 = LMG 11596]KFI57289.1 putative ABC transporter, ATP-binding protein [Bifidobacterium gallicum DSM 20093 = LMG 11596]
MEGTQTYVPTVHVGPQTLVVVENRHASIYPLGTRPSWTFGRINDHSHPDIAVESAIVSREHGRFFTQGGQWFYQVASTTNPTFINGRRLAGNAPPCQLHNGDIIRVDYSIETPDDDGVFLIFTVDQHLGQWTSYPLTQRTTFIGRAPAPNTIVQQVPYVSRRHARIDHTPRGYVIRDMGSRIGTYLNDDPVRGAMLLREKDIISIGDCRFYYTDGCIVYDRRNTTSIPQRTAQTRPMQAGRPAPVGQPGVAAPLRTPMAVNPQLMMPSKAARVQTMQTMQSLPTLQPMQQMPAMSPVQEHAVMIDVNVVEKHVGGRKKLTLLKNIHCTIREHSMVAIIGTSGAGKTLLLNCLSGKDYEFQGRTLLRGQDIKNNHRRLRSAIGYVRQSNVFSPPLTVQEELMASARLRLPDDYNREQLEQKVSYVLDALNLSEHRNKAIRTLSGGQQRRVSVAREFIGFPSVLFLDEPDAGLSYLDKKELFTQLNAIVKKGETGDMEEDATVSSVIMVVHEIDMLDMFDQVIVVAAPSRKDGSGREPGQLAFAGRPQDAKTYFNNASDYRKMFDELQAQLDKHTFRPFVEQPR